MALHDGIPKAVDLYDNFNDNSLDATKWASFGTGVAEASSELELTSTLAAGYKGIYSQTNWDMTDSEISVQLVDAGNQALASWQVIPVLAQSDASNQLYWLVQANTLYAVKVVAGVSTNVYSVAYSSSTHKYLKIRERFGRFYYEYSTDGEIWTTAYTMNTPFDVGNVSLQIQCGTYAIEASTTVGKFDNFNCQASLRTDAKTPSSYGIVSNEFTTGANGLVIDGNFATNGVTGKKQDYYNYGIVIPTGATVVGVEVLLTAKTTGGTHSYAIDLTWNAGTSFTATKSQALSTTLTTYSIGGATDTWGRTWAANDFSNGLFRLRITETLSGGGSSQLDGTAIRVYYTFSQTALIEDLNDIRKRMTIKADGLFGDLYSAFSYPTDNNLGFSGGFIYSGSNLALYHNLNVGQVWNATSAEVGYIRFDTSAIPDNARIISARLEMYTSAQQNAVAGWKVEARAYNFGHRLDTSDWFNTTKIVDKLPLLAVHNASELKFGDDPNDFVSTMAMVDNINVSGYTSMMLVSNRLVNNVYGDYGGSSNADKVSFYTPSDYGYEPRLVIEYDDTVDYPDGNREKQIEIQLFDKNENFVKKLTTVSDDYAIANEINSAGSSFDFDIAEDMDSVDEDYLIGAIIKIYAYDEVRADGILIYDGKITGVLANQKNLKITTVARSSDMGRYSFEKIVSTTTYNPGSASTISGSSQKSLSATTTWAAQGFVPSYTNLSQVALWATTVLDDTQVCIYDANGTQPGDLLSVATDVRSSGYDNSAGANYYTATFATPLDLQIGQKYFVVIKGIATIMQNTSFTTDGTLWNSSNSGTSWTEDTTKDLHIVYYFGTYSTTVSYTDTDPAYIVRDVLDSYARIGGQVVYDGGSVLYTNSTETDSVDTDITLTIQNVSILEALRTALQYAPRNWYFVVDVAQQKLYFKQRADDAEYALVVGENVSNPEINITDRDMANLVYFTGGQSGGSNLYIKGTKQGSIDLYGRYATQITDNRVTSSATALKAISKVLSEKGSPTIEGRVVVADVPVNGVRGYIIENLIPGQTINFVNIGTWGVQKLDSIILDDVWLDYKLYDYSTFVLQIQKVTLKPSVLEIQFESPRADVTKVMNEQAKKLNDQQTVANPTTPS